MLTENTNTQYKIYWILLGLIALITIYPFFEIGIASGDDMMYYHLSFREKLWPLAFEFAKDNGRFYFAIVNPLYTFPYTFDNFFFTKTIQYSSLLLSFFVFSQVIKKIFKSTPMGMVFLIFLFTTLSVSKWTSLIVCYPFCFCFSFTLILCSILLLLNYLETGNKKFIVFSAIIYFLGLLFYEIYLIYLLIVAIIVISHYYNKDTPFPYLTTIKTLTPFIILGFVYLITYFTFYFLYPTNYGGNSISQEIKIKTALSILNNYPESAFPLSVFYQNQAILQSQSDIISGYKNDLLYLFMHAKVEWVVKAVLISTLFVSLILKLPKITIRKASVGGLVVVILIYLSHILLVITKKYNEYSEIKGYIPTFYSFFGVTLLLTLLCALFYSFTSQNKTIKTIYIGLCVFFLLTCSIKTSYSNFYTAKDMAQSKMAFDIVDSFCEWKKFNKIPDNSILYAEDLWKNSSTQTELFHKDFNWGSHIYNKKKKILYLANDSSSFNSLKEKNPSNHYFLLKKWEAHKTKEAFLSFFPIDSLIAKGDPLKFSSNKMTIFYYSTYKEFSVSFKFNALPLQSKKIQVETFEDSTNENYYSINISNNNKNSSSTIFEINAPNIDVNSIMISNIKFQNRPTIEVY